ncbi:DUF2808 domain-containing protein [Nostoc sp. CCY0012]|uniref:DUF2808 domain-containing protein n=1 Tax=Nostoc sp. CCY0012 TaxID=1056123 RepID=UPI0039C5B558
MLHQITQQVGTSAVLLGMIMGLNPVNLSAQARQINSSQQSMFREQQSTVFNRVPRLINSGATHKERNVASTYYFTIVVPENAPDALKAVTINQNPGSEIIKFNVAQSRAFSGNKLAGDTSISLTPIGGIQSSDMNQVTLVFDQPLQPGNLVTLSLRVEQNPRYDDIYSFGVTTFPDNEKSPNLYLGEAKITITDS